MHYEGGSCDRLADRGAKHGAVTQPFPLCWLLCGPCSPTLSTYHVLDRRWLHASMNGIVRNALRATALRGMLSSSCGNNGGQSARTLWNVCCRRQTPEIAPLVPSFKLYDLHNRRYYSKSHTKGMNPSIESCRHSKCLVGLIRRNVTSRSCPPKKTFHLRTKMF